MIDVPSDFKDHEIGNIDCPQCDAYPCECGGIVHREYLDESWDSVYFSYWCDSCGSTLNPY